MLATWQRFALKIECSDHPVMLFFGWGGVMDVT